MSSVLAGQSMTSGAQEVMVRTDVVDTVMVVTPPTVPLVGKGAALVMTPVEEAPVETPVETPVDNRTVEETASADSDELRAGAVVLSRLNRMYRGCEYAEVRAAKSPRATVADFILILMV
jgi:hypothetical protein